MEPTIAITGYPLSRDFKLKLESLIKAPVEFILISDLRKLPFSRLITTLFKIKAKVLYLPLETTESQSLLPILSLLSAFTRSKKIVIVYPDLKNSQLNRVQIFSHFFSILTAGLKGLVSLFVFHQQVKSLAKKERMRFSFKRGGLVYLKTNLWFGVKAGGSVGHIAGVANAMRNLVNEVFFCSVEQPVNFRDDIHFSYVTPQKVFAMPAELNLYTFHSLFTRQVCRNPLFKDAGIVYHRLSLGNFTGVAVSRALKLPLILEYNGSEVWVARNWGRKLRFERTAEMAEEASFRHAHIIVTVSDVLKEELIEKGVEAERIVSYPNCIDPEMFNPLRYSSSDIKNIRDRHHISENAKVITFIGTFGQWHGVEVLAESIKQLIDTKKVWLDEHKVHFLLVGDGDKRTIVEQILNHEKYADYFTLTGLVPQAEAPAYLASSDILVSPHVKNPDGTRFFGSPTKLFEYMAMGKPILASDLDQIGVVLAKSLKVLNPPEKKPNPETPELAILMEPGNVEHLIKGLEFLVENPVWGKALGENARKEALLKYTWEKHVQAIINRMEELYETKF